MNIEEKTRALKVIQLQSENLQKTKNKILEEYKGKQIPAGCQITLERIERAAERLKKEKENIENPPKWWEIWKKI